MKRTGKKVGGISANSLVMPIVVVLAILHIVIIGLILAISAYSGSLSRIMQDSGAYTQDATSLLASSSLLSETASHYVLMPVTETLPEGAWLASVEHIADGSTQACGHTKETSFVQRTLHTKHAHWTHRSRGNHAYQHAFENQVDYVNMYRKRHIDCKFTNFP